MNILFVCTGNTCRSPMAEGYLKYLCRKNKTKGIDIKSAGIGAITGYSASEEVLLVLKKFGIDLSRHRSQRITASLLEWADLVIVMTQEHKDIINRSFPSFDKRIVLLKDFTDDKGDIFDPIGGDFLTYKTCFSDMKKALDDLFATLER